MLKLVGVDSRFTVHPFRRKYQVAAVRSRPEMPRQSAMYTFGLSAKAVGTSISRVNGVPTGRPAAGRTA